MAQGIDELFANFETAAPMFLPAPVAAVEAAVRRRRRTAGIALLAIVLAAVAIPTVIVSPTRGTPQSKLATVPTRDSTYENRPMRIPGIESARFSLGFVDSEHGWALQLCESDVPCPRVVAATSDGGRSWRVVPTPDLTNKIVSVWPLDPQTMALWLHGEGFLLTTDGGATFSSYPDSAPPEPVLLAYASGLDHDGYMVRCPGTTGLENPWDVACDRQQLVRIGSGPVDPQPVLSAVPGHIRSEILVGGDGRIWIIDSNTALETPPDPVRIRVSADGRNWRELPAPPGGSNVSISPDGMDFWLIGLATHRFVDGGWRAERVQAFPTIVWGNATALDDGVLAVASDRGLMYYRDGVWRRSLGIPAEAIGQYSHVETLPDGTLAVHAGSGLFLGIEDGVERSWVKIAFD